LAKLSTKAALISALVFPGVGHIYLKNYRFGILLAGISFAAIYYLIARAVESALEITQKIQSGGIRLDLESISVLMTQRASGAGDQLLSMAATALTICWLIGIFDSYRIGRAQEQNVDASVNRPK